MENPMSLEPQKVRYLVVLLTAATAVCVAMVLGRFAYVWDLRFRFCGLLFNLALAWIPLLLSLLISRVQAKKRFFSAGLLLVWLLFFPNTFYLITDLIHDHKFGMDGVDRWYDILMTACFAVAGMFLGSYSLYIVDRVVTDRHGVKGGWFFAVTVLALAAYGTYLGRVLRLNSWDAILRPIDLVERIASGPGSAKEAALFSLSFFLFTTITYTLVIGSLELNGRSRLAEKSSV